MANLKRVTLVIRATVESDSRDYDRLTRLANDSRHGFYGEQRVSSKYAPNAQKATRWI